MKISHLCTGIFMFAVTAGPGAAQWAHQEHGSAFEDEKTQIALTSHGRYAVGLRCTEASDLTLIFITPEVVDRDVTSTINMAAPEILVRVDQNDAFSLAAEGDTPDGKLTFHAAAPKALAQQLEAARSGVSVATKMLGSVYHETKFNVRGSTASIGKLKELCDLTAG
jgi:hypothetical protein